MINNFGNDLSPKIELGEKIIDPVSNQHENIFIRAKRAASKSIIIACGLLLVGLLMIVVFALPISQIVIGSIHMNSCPMDPRIPIYLIVAGIFTLFLLIIFCIRVVLENSCLVLCLKILIWLFCLGWYITGTVWIFRDKKIVQYSSRHDLNTYCEYSLFNFAYITMFFGYGFLFGTICNNTK